MEIGSRTIAEIAIAVAAALLAAAWLWLDARYFPASELDAKPYPMRRIDLDFPPPRGGVEYYGKLKLKVFINSRGDVDRVEIVTASVPASFREIAVTAISGARWEPARKWGLRVKSVKVIEIDFEPPVRGIDRPITQPDQ